MHRLFHFHWHVNIAFSHLHIKADCKSKQRTILKLALVLLVPMCTTIFFPFFFCIQINFYVLRGNKLYGTFHIFPLKKWPKYVLAAVWD